jgi:predicted Rossmann-fold nucleotide-binding protein
MNHHRQLRTTVIAIWGFIRLLLMRECTMKIAVIGPSNIERVAGAAGVDPGKIRKNAADAGRAIATSGHELVVVPDQGVPVIAARAYRDAAGRRVLGLIPTSGHSAKGATSRVQRNSSLCDESYRDLTWYEQHSKLVKVADAMLCVGVSCGTICEIAWTKWTKKIPVFVLNGLGSRIPPEIEAETDVRYIDRPGEAIDILETRK